MKLSWKVIVFATLLGCAVGKNQPQYTIGYQSFECMGNCPVYKLSVDSKRNLIFEGIKNSKEGVSNDRLTKTEYNKLLLIVNQLMEQDVSDGPKLNALDAGGKELEVRNGDKRRIFAMEKEKPELIKLDQLMNQILSARGLVSN